MMPKESCDDQVCKVDEDEVQLNFAVRQSTLYQQNSQPKRPKASTCMALHSDHGIAGQPNLAATVGPTGVRTKRWRVSWRYDTSQGVDWIFF